MNDRSLVRMEKRAANKGGLFLIILIALVGLGVGGYFIYQNKDEINWPWQEKEEKKEDEENPISNENNSSNGKLHLPEISPEIDILKLRIKPADLYVTKLKATSKGYELELTLKLSPNKDLYNEDSFESYEVDCTKILIDDYEVSPTFKLKITQAKPTDSTSITIPMSELENLEMYSFRALSFFFTTTRTESGTTLKPEYSESRVTAYQDIFVDNTKDTMLTFNAQDSVKISYYKKIEAEDATYLYYVVENNNKVHSHKIEIKKLVINDEIYNKPSIEVDSHYNAKTMFYIKIPRKDFSEVNKIKSSFFILRPEGEDQAIFMTNDYIVDYTKEETK